MLTSPRREKQRRVLATVAVSSGRCSGSGEVVPVNLFASREKEHAHEHLGNERNQKRPLARRDTVWNDVATGKALRRRCRAELGEKTKFWRLGRLEGVLRSALSSQGCGEGGGRLDSTGDGPSVVYLRERVVGVLRLWTGKPCDAVCSGAQGERKTSAGRPRRVVTRPASSYVAARRARGVARPAGAQDRSL